MDLGGGGRDGLAVGGAGRSGGFFFSATASLGSIVDVAGTVPAAARSAFTDLTTVSGSAACACSTAGSGVGSACDGSDDDSSACAADASWLAVSKYVSHS